MNKMKKLSIIIIFGIILLLSCKNKNIELVNNKTFTELETKELLTLIQKFDKTLCEIERQDANNINECYESFFERIWEEIQLGNYNIGINNSKQQEILNSLSEELKSEIWFYGTGIINRRYPENSNNLYPDTVKSVSINRNKYYLFLKNEAAIINSNTNQYYEGLEVVGTISPSMFADSAENYSNYNIKDERIKLLIAIHYLTLNQNNLIRKDSYKRLERELNLQMKY